MSNKNNPSQGRVRERLGPMWQQSQTMVGWNRQDKRQSKTRRNIKIEFPFQNGIENGFAAHAQQLIVLHFFTPSAIQALVNRTMMNHAVTKRTLRFNSLKTCNHSSLQVQCLSGCRCTCIFIHVSQLNRHVFHLKKKRAGSLLFRLRRSKMEGSAAFFEICRSENPFIFEEPLHPSSEKSPAYQPSSVQSSDRSSGPEIDGGGFFDLRGRRSGLENVGVLRSLVPKIEHDQFSN